MPYKHIIETETERAMALDYLRAAPLPHRVEMCGHRQRRSDRQNKRYWPAIVQPLAEWLVSKSGQGEHISADAAEEMAHQILKDTFLRVPVVDAETGEVIFKPDGDPLMRTKSTTELDTAEFNAYTDAAADLASRLTGRPVPRERKERREEAMAQPR